MSDASPAGSRAKARFLGIFRAMLWYRKKQPEKDWVLKVRIEETLREFPAYGYRRAALHLKENKKKVQRVMRLFGIKAYRRRGRRWKKPRKQAVSYPNLLMLVTPAYPNHVWVADRAALGRMGIKKASMESSRQSLAIRNALRRSVSWLLKYTLRFIGTTRTASTPHFVCHRANSLPRTHLLCYDHSPKRVD